MKQITFNYFRRLALMLLAVVGFTTTAYAQDWQEIYQNALVGENSGYEVYYEGDYNPFGQWQSISELDPSGKTQYFDPHINDCAYLVYTIQDAGTYKFQFRFKQHDGNNTKLNMFWANNNADLSQESSKNIVKEGVTIPQGTIQNIETGEFNLEPGTYYFGFYITDKGSSCWNFLFADFRLFKKNVSSPTTFTVNFSNIENGTVEVTANGEKIDSGDAVEDGTEITITPTANPGYRVKTVYANGTKLAPKPETVDGQIIMRYKTTVTENTEITAEILPVEYSISISTATNGSIVVYNVTDLENPLENNAKLTAGNQVKVVATPNPDYKLARVYYKYTGYNYEGEAIEITDNGEGYIFTVGPDPESANTAIYIYAEFVEIVEPVEPYAQNFGQGVGDTGWGYRSWTNTVFKTSTDGTKTVNVNYKTNVNSYEIYSNALVSEENKATVFQGEQFELTINGEMNWLYTLVYIDWNGDGVFDEDKEGVENLGYNPTEERLFGDNTPTKSGTRTYNVTVPTDAKVGDTRVRIILGWKQENVDLIPSGEEKVAKYITSTEIDDTKNAMARDFALCIKDNEISPRTITLNVNDPSMGKAVITGTEDTSITTSDINVSVTAVPEEGYMFVNWTDEEGEVLSIDNPYLYGGLEDVTLTANFTEKTYPVMTRKYTTLDQQNRYLKEVVATVGGEAQTLFTATSTSELPLTEYTTAEEVTEKGALIDKTATPIVLEQGTTSFDMTFKAWTENILDSYNTQLIWTSQAIYVDWNNDKDFDDANECLGAVGTPDSGNNFGDTNGSLENGWTRTLNVPADVAAGTYRMRVVYHESKVDGWENTFFSAGKGNINAGVSYDFYIQIEEQAETWSEVHFNSLSGSSSNEINLNNDPYYIYPEQTGTDNWNTTNSSGASETANKFGPYIKDVAEGYYLAYRYEIEQKATYRFSFLHKKAETIETTAKLCYTTDLAEAFTDASDVVALEKKKGDETGVLLQSNNIDLEKGSYYFIYYIVSGGTSKVRIADFKLEMLDGSAVEPTMPSITVKKPVNGSLFIEYTVNDETQEIDTYAFENDSEVFSIPENTVMNIYPTAEYDYELDQILPEGMEEKTDLRGRKYYVLTVTGDATIEATFKAILYGNISITKPEEEQGSIEIEFKNPMSGEWQVADDFYLGAVVFGTELRAKVEAKTGYTLKSVMKNGTPIDKNADGYYYFTVDAEAITISAEFEQEQGTYYTITIDVTKPEQGSVKVEMTENGEIKNVANGDKVKENTELTITPEANEGYIFTTLLIDNRPVQLTDGSYKMTVTKDTKIAPKFKEVVSSFELNWVEPENGTLKLYKTSDLENPLTQKSSIEVGTEIKVVVEENEGYDLSKVYYKYFPTEKTVDIAEGENGYVFTVEADNENPSNSIIYVYADFEPETYTLTTEVTPAEGGSVSVTVDYEAVEETVKYGDVITVTVKENPGYIHENTVVEGAEKVEGQAGKYTVKGNVTIKVTFKKDTSSINSIENGTVYYNAEEEVLYTGTAKSVRVYDLSGRLVINAENQDNVSLAELAEGIYTAVVDNVTLKLKK